MGRSRLGFFVAATLAALPAGAAELTRVLSVEPNYPFALQLSARYDREQERATITREQGATGSGPVVDRPELRYGRIRNDVVSRFAVALYTDLELHVEVPYVLGDDTSWRSAVQNGIPVTGTITNTSINPLGQMTQPYALFSVGTSDTTVFHGGRVGDVKAGLAWAVFNDRRDDTKPTWVVGLDATLPTAELYDPAKDRTGPNRGSPYFVDTKRGPLGEKIWKWDFYTALSKQIGAFDPYFKVHVTGMTPTAATYSNCDHASDLGFNAANCSDPKLKDDAKARLPYLLGVTFGTELIPYEDAREDQKVAFDLRFFADYTSRQRFYNELTDASGRIHMTEAYATLGGLAALYLRASKNLSLDASAALSTKTSHFLSGEYLGDPAKMNPNFDARYDAVGNRFRITEASVFTVSATGKLEF
jgi:hypothetical protein